MRKKKIVILNGAGFNASPDFGGITTKSITDRFIDFNLTRTNDLEIGGIKPGEYFNNLISSYYHANNTMQQPVNLSIVNFETIVHSIEELYAFYSDLNSQGRLEYRGITPALFDAVLTLNGDLVAKDTNPENYLKRLYPYLINEIIQEIIPTNNGSNKNGLVGFRDDFLKKYLSDRKWVKRIYTTNYDTWLNKYAGYYDGFDTNGEFEESLVAKNTKINCHYNIHGCIHWDLNINSNRVSKLDNPIDILGRGRSNDPDQDRRPLLPSPIITGYNKPSRMKFQPYLSLFYSLQNDLYDADILLIIGYSFGDIHINNLIDTFKGKVIIVDYFRKWVEAVSNNDDIDVWDDDIRNYLDFIVCPADNGFPQGDVLVRNPFIASNSGRIKIWWKGIGTDFYNNWKALTK